MEKKENKPNNLEKIREKLIDDLCHDTESKNCSFDILTHRICSPYDLDIKIITSEEGTSNA